MSGIRFDTVGQSHGIHLSQSVGVHSNKERVLFPGKGLVEFGVGNFLLRKENLLIILLLRCPRSLPVRFTGHTKAELDPISEGSSNSLFFEELENWVPRVASKSI